MPNLAVQVADLNTAYSRPLKETSKDRHKGGYFRNYYLKNREKFLAYSHDYYSVKKLLTPYLPKKERDQKERKKVLNNFFLSHTRRTLTIARKNKELFFLGEVVLKNLETTKKNWNGD